MSKKKKKEVKTTLLVQHLFQNILSVNCIFYISVFLSSPQAH